MVVKGQATNQPETGLAHGLDKSDLCLWKGAEVASFTSLLTSPLDVLPVGSLVCLNVCEPPHFVPYGVEFLACTASVCSSSRHFDLLF